MNYTLSRDGQALGTCTFEEVRDQLQTGRLLATDFATLDGGTTVTVAQLLNPTPPPALPPADSFLVRRGGEQWGPYSFPELQRYAREGRFLASDVTWCAGMATWESVTQVLQRRGVVLPPPRVDTNESLKWVIPVGRSGLAIAAGYLALFSVLLLPAPAALIVGLLALRDLKKNPKKGGIGRAWFGVIAGGLGTLACILIFGTALLGTLKR